jgi:cation diffusion facilitator CzcD-associated flavoprotein CzcO
MNTSSGEHVDVLIVGAGLSGVGAACRLRQHCPDKTFAIFEARDAIGGTWDLFRFPGVRSDSDMFTLAYPFRPWRGAQSIVDGGSIRRYIRETASEYGVDAAIRFRHRVVRAQWSSEDARWRVEAERGDTGETVSITCGFLFSCTGYYRYEEGYTPEFPGVERFQGEVVHPQFWREDVQYAGKRVIVIGSGATAVTLVPAMAERAEHVTMLQRSPSYIISIPALDPIAGVLSRVLPARLAYRIVRWKNVWLTLAIYGLSRRRPAAMKRLIRRLMERQLPAGFDIDRHFSPTYDPWDQRMCLVPDNDLFQAIKAGRVSVVTDRIETFTERGVALASGTELKADVIVTATGLSMVPLGNIPLSVDDREVELPDTLVYRGMLLSGVPNLAFAFGYINQSWTLGSDLTSEHVCRLLRFMDEHGYDTCTPRHDDAPVATIPFAELSSGYILRSIDRFPRQRAGDPWQRVQHYPRDRRSVVRSPIDDPALEFSRASDARRAEPIAA